MNMTSGESLTNSLFFDLLGIYIYLLEFNQYLFIISFSIIKLMISNKTYTNKMEDITSQINGVTQYSIVNGSFEFKKLTIYGEAGHTYYLIVYTQAIENNTGLIFNNEKIDESNLYLTIKLNLLESNQLFTIIFILFSATFSSMTSNNIIKYICSLTILLLNIQFFYFAFKQIIIYKILKMKKLFENKYLARFTYFIHFDQLSSF